ncbi:MAG TPA: hypothetical protein VEV84_06680 [Pyrinomonadaceae bacterium]|nr:hypothetical protein [Pyrinomonadaceae bacterium]
MPGKGVEWTVEKEPELDRSESNFIERLKKADNIITFGLDADQTKEKWFPKLNTGRMLDALILKTMSKDYDSGRRLSLYRVQIMNLAGIPEQKVGYPKAFLELRCKVNGSVWKDD